MYAPSSRNLQPWEFIVIKNDEESRWDHVRDPKMKEIMESAPLIIVICADTMVEENKAVSVMDCSAATENLLLEASSMNLGSLWYGIFPHEKRMNDIKNILELPEHIMPVSLIIIGNIAEEKEKQFRFHKSKIHYNKW